jgi:DNA-binding transcriptional regulator YdaS (Cro superfamily)
VKTADAVLYFGSKAKLAEQLGISPGALSQWGEEVPPLRQLQIERITGGRLAASPDVFATKEEKQ